jgi:PAS domain S-box-containing protein
VSVTRKELGDEDPIVRAATDASALGMAFELEAKADGSRRFTFVGHRCLAVNGVPAEIAMTDAATLYNLILPEHRAAFDAAEAVALEKMQPFDIEVAMRRADGEVRWHRIVSAPRRRPDGAVLWDGLQVDVTDRRQIAAELEEQRHRLEVAVEATGLGFWEWDIEAGAVTWSDRNKALFGLRPSEEVTVERYLALVHPDDVESVRAAFLSARDKPDGGDYSIEHRVVTPTGETRWILAHARVAKNPEGGARLAVGTSLDVTARKNAEERRALLMGELAHRAKNGIAVIMAMVSQTARSQATVEGFEELLIARLQAMANSQDLVTASGGRPVDLADVVGQAVAPFGQTRFDLDGGLAGVTIRGEIAVGMGLLLHEMATNAVKYGALSTRAGRVAIALEDAPDDKAVFAWRETGGPEVTPSDSRGFGTRLLNQVLRNQGGDVKFSFEPQGFQARVAFPVAQTD